MSLILHGRVLAYTPASAGSATVTVRLQDNGGWTQAPPTLTPTRTPTPTGTPTPTPTPAPITQGLIVLELTVSPKSVNAGVPSTITFRVTRTGAGQGSYEFPLLINGNPVFTATGTLALGASRVHSTTITRSTSGTYTVQVENLKGSFNVLRVPGAAFTISELQVSPQTVQAGQPVTITVKVSNIGDAAGSKTVTLRINGTAEDTKEVTISAGAAQTVSFTVTRDRGGQYNVDMDGQTSSFEVSSKPGAPIGLIMGIVLAVLVVAGGAVYFFVLRRRPPATSAP